MTEVHKDCAACPLLCVVELVHCQAKQLSGRDHFNTEDEHSSNEVHFDEQHKKTDLDRIRLITVGSIQKAAGSRGVG